MLINMFSLDEAIGDPNFFVELAEDVQVPCDFDCVDPLTPALIGMDRTSVTNTAT